MMESNAADSVTYPPEKYIHHRRGMLLVDRVESCDAHSIVTQTTVNPSQAFFDDKTNSLPSWVGLEILAQTAAIWVGVDDEQNGKPIQLGFLLGSREYAAQTGWFGNGETLRAEIAPTYSEGETRIFAGQIFDQQGVKLAFGNLTAFRPNNENQYLQLGPL